MQRRHAHNSMSRLYRSPMLMHMPSLTQNNPTSFSPELILQAVFTLPIDDLEQIERITAELVRTP